MINCFEISTVVSEPYLVPYLFIAGETTSVAGSDISAIVFAYAFTAVGCVEPRPISDPHYAHDEYSVALAEYPETVPFPDENEYMNAVTSQMRCKKARQTVAAELMIHIEDQTQDFLAQGMSTFDAATLGAYIHGQAGELAAYDMSVYSVTASDILSYIGKAMKENG